MFKNTAFYVKPIKVHPNDNKTDEQAAPKFDFDRIGTILKSLLKEATKNVVAIIMAYKIIDTLTKMLFHIVKTTIK